MEKFSILELINHFSISGDSKHKQFFPQQKVVAVPQLPEEGRVLRLCGTYHSKLPLFLTTSPLKCYTLPSNNKRTIQQFIACSDIQIDIQHPQKNRIKTVEAWAGWRRPDRSFDLLGFTFSNKVRIVKYY